MRLFIKQSYRIVSSVEKMQKVKTLELQRQKEENQHFYKNVQCVTVKKQNLIKSKKLVDYEVA